jgi:alpha-tubulin suppressor-like RCC1 family protein
MPNPITNFKDNFGTDLGNKLITKEYLMTVYPQIANQLITPELWVWGDSSSGQLGINLAGTTNSRSTPVTTSAGGANWKQVDTSRFLTAAIKTDGTLWIWGVNNNARLGINNNTTSPICTPVTTFAGGTNWKQVACGNNHMAAIKTDGTLWVWGLNTSGQLGINNTTSPICTPVTTFSGGNNWKQVACGQNLIAAIKTDGTLWTWGNNTSGSLGINDASNRTTPVTTFLGGTNWKQVSAGGKGTTSSNVAAIKTDGTLWVWGLNGTSGALGINAAGSRSTPVTTFAGGTNWKQVACDNFHVTAIKTDGTLWTWGDNANGQLGINNAVDRSTPVTTFAGGTNWKQVDCGDFNTSAIKTDGTLWTWGSNASGALGINDAVARSIPVTTFAGGTNWKQVACGTNITVAIKTSDDLQGI